MVKSGKKWVTVEFGGKFWGKVDSLRVVVKVGILAILDHIFVSDTAKSGVELSGAHEAAGQLSGDGGREGSIEDTRRVSGRIEGVREPVLHHQHDR